MRLYRSSKNSGRNPKPNQTVRFIAMGFNSRSKAVLPVRSSKRDTEVVDLFCEGWSQNKLAAKFRLTQARIAQIISAQKRQWAERRAADMGEQQDEALGLLDHLRMCAWQAYRLSCRPARETQKESEKRLRKLERAEKQMTDARNRLNPKDENGKLRLPNSLRVPEELMVIGEKEKEVSKDRCEGNPRFMEIARWCVEARLKMTGLLTEVKLEQKNLNIFDWEAFGKGPPEPPVDEVTLAIRSKLGEVMGPIEEVEPDVLLPEERERLSTA